MGGRAKGRGKKITEGSCEMGGILQDADMQSTQCREDGFGLCASVYEAWQMSTGRVGGDPRKHKASC